jgi:hypothetical protein
LPRGGEGRAGVGTGGSGRIAEAVITTYRSRTQSQQMQSHRAPSSTPVKTSSRVASSPQKPHFMGVSDIRGNRTLLAILRHQSGVGDVDPEMFAEAVWIAAQFLRPEGRRFQFGDEFAASRSQSRPQVRLAGRDGGRFDVAVFVMDHENFHRLTCAAQVRAAGRRALRGSCAILCRAKLRGGRATTHSEYGAHPSPQLVTVMLTRLRLFPSLAAAPS